MGQNLERYPDRTVTASAGALLGPAAAVRETAAHLGADGKATSNERASALTVAFVETEVFSLRWG